jgi:hypothetical protein
MISYTITVPPTVAAMSSQLKETFAESDLEFTSYATAENFTNSNGDSLTSFSPAGNATRRSWDGGETGSFVVGAGTSTSLSATSLTSDVSTVAMQTTQAQTLTAQKTVTATTAATASVGTTVGASASVSTSSTAATTTRTTASNVAATIVTTTSVDVTHYAGNSGSRDYATVLIPERNDLAWLANGYTGRMDTAADLVTAATTVYPLYATASGAVSNATVTSATAILTATDTFTVSASSIVTAPQPGESWDGETTEGVFSSRTTTTTTHSRTSYGFTNVDTSTTSALQTVTSPAAAAGLTWQNTHAFTAAITTTFPWSGTGSYTAPDGNYTASTAVSWTRQSVGGMQTLALLSASQAKLTPIGRAGLDGGAPAAAISIAGFAPGGTTALQRPSVSVLFPSTRSFLDGATSVTESLGQSGGSRTSSFTNASTSSTWSTSGAWVSALAGYTNADAAATVVIGGTPPSATMTRIVPPGIFGTGGGFSTFIAGTTDTVGTSPSVLEPVSVIAGGTSRYLVAQRNLTTTV